MMSDWKECTIGEIASVKGGKRLPKGVNLITEQNAHPYIRIRDLTEKTLELKSSYEYVDNETQKCISRYIVGTGDILISIVGTIGLVAVVGESLNGANLTENCVKLIDIREDVDREYLYYFLVSNMGQDEIKKGTVGAVQPKLPIKNIQSIKLYLPHIDIQKRISGLLSAIDCKIAQNTAINENLEQQAQAIYAQMFIESAEESWETGSLSDISVITMGQSPKGDTFNETGEGAVFYQGRTDFGFRFPTRRLYTTEPKRIALCGDALMSVRAPVGDLNVAYEECCIGRGLAAIHSKDNHQSFVLYTLFTLKKQLDVFNGEGTVFGSINKESLNSMEITIPPRELMDRFESTVSPIDRAIRNNYEEICRLQAIRDTLLPKLMNGEIDVSAVRI